jgi:predicted RNA-binding Zn ribbon-like protein
VDLTEQPDRLVALAVDVVNLPDERLDAPGLGRFLVEHGEQEPVELTTDDVRALAEVRVELAEVFDVAAGGDTAGTAERINRLLERAQRTPRLSDHDGSPWHLHVTDDDAPWADWLAAVAGLGLARMLVDDGVARLGRCAAPSCQMVFAGGPRNHPRRYCSTTCANRTRVAAFRARKRQVGAGA